MAPSPRGSFNFSVCKMQFFSVMSSWSLSAGATAPPGTPPPGWRLRRERPPGGLPPPRTPRLASLARRKCQS
eukprot:12937762-Alexandrium_andersonii.AAC.1